MGEVGVFSSWGSPVVEHLVWTGSSQVVSLLCIYCLLRDVSSVVPVRANF